MADYKYKSTEKLVESFTQFNEDNVESVSEDGTVTWIDVSCKNLIFIPEFLNIKHLTHHESTTISIWATLHGRSIMLNLRKDTEEKEMNSGGQ